MEKLQTILGNLGLDGAMAEVFACLANKKKATLEEIYEETPLSRKAISQALAALLSEGAVKRDGPAYTIENVREALMALLPARYEELKAEIYSYRHAPGQKVCPRVEAVRGDPSADPSFMAKHIDAALASIEIVSGPLEWLNDESLNAARAAVQRGVIVRVIAFRHPGLEAEARALADAGVEVRSHEYAEEMAFVVIDGEFAAFALKEPARATKPASFRLLVKDKSACRMALDYLFEPAWKDAGTVEEHRI